MKKQIFSLFVIISLLSSLVFADGGMIIHKPQGWEIFDEEKQFCAINYENGYQNMILSINFGSDTKGADKAVWIFPIPADPDETVVDIIKGFPQLNGYDIKEKAKQKISQNFQYMRGTQIYPLFFFARYMFGAINYMETATIGKGMAEDAGPSMYIYEHIEKMGVTTELVRVRDGQVLQDYFEAKQLVLPSKAREVFDEYIGQDYIFVISWIYDIEQLKQPEYDPYNYGQYNAVGVSLTFPTDKIYFPLKPTSIYGSKVVPATIYVMDYVTPELYDSIKSTTKVEYLYQNYYSVPQNLQLFFNTQTNIQDLKYTKITMNPPSKYLIDDLYFEEKAPREISRAEFFINNSTFIGWTIFILCCMLASLIAALLSFRKDTNIITFLLLGLTNILSIIGIIVGIFFIKTKKLDPKLKEQIKKAGVALTVWDKRKVLFVVLFSVGFLILTWIFEKLIISML